jgi:RHS repeat-associated protein
VIKNYVYDDLGRRTEVSSECSVGSQDRRIASSAHYNDNGQVEWVEDAAGNRTTYTYDPDSGQRTAVENALTNTIHYAYDFAGRVTNEWGATYPVEYVYDDYGRMYQLKTYRDETGTPDNTTWQYDLATGLMTNKVYADQNGTAYDYYPDGKLSSRTWARTAGVPPAPFVTEYAYDALGLLTNIDYSASDTPDIGITYNRLGQRASVTDAAGYREFDYDLTTGMLTNEAIWYIEGTVSNHWNLARSVDAFGRNAGYDLSTAGVPPAQSVDYGYDSLGRFSSVTSSVSSVTSVVNYDWMPGANLLNGYSTAGGSPALSVSYAYETDRNFKTNVTNRAGSALISSFDYTYDEIGRRTDRADTFEDNPSVDNSFGYNARDEVTSAIMNSGTYSYNFDDIGNRESCSVGSQSQTYVANELNQYTAITGGLASSPSYDTDGNMTSDGNFTYTWNGENRLVVAERTAGVSPATRIEYAYDYMGRMFKRTVNGNDSHYIWDGWNMVAEISGSETNSYIWGLDLSLTPQGAGGVGGLLSSVRSQSGASPDAHYFAYDANGNVSDLVDESGDVVAHYEYDAFGNKTASSGAYADSNPWQFSTKYWEPETGLLHYELRPYVPNLGRWLSRDPIGERGGVALHGFVGNGAINQWDLMGLERHPLYLNRVSKGGWVDIKQTPENICTDKGKIRVEITFHWHGDGKEFPSDPDKLADRYMGKGAITLGDQELAAVPEDGGYYNYLDEPEEWSWPTREDPDHKETVYAYESWVAKPKAGDSEGGDSGADQPITIDVPGTDGKIEGNAKLKIQYGRKSGGSYEKTQEISISWSFVCCDGVLQE